MEAIMLYEFKMRGHEFRAYYMPGESKWLVKNERAMFDFPGREDDGMGKVKATLKRVLRDQYRYLLENAHRVIVCIKGCEGYLDTFPFRTRKDWAKSAVLVPLT